MTLEFFLGVQLLPQGGDLIGELRVELLLLLVALFRTRLALFGKLSRDFQRKG